MPQFSGTVNIGVSANLSNSVDVGQVNYPISYGINYLLQNGNGDNQANEVFTDTRTIAASGSENLDLSGVLADVFGSTINFTRIKALIIKADQSNTNDVLVGGHASAAVASLFGDATDKARVKPGGAVAFIAPNATGYTVTATTADMLTVANSSSGSSVTYTIIIIGTI
ncbi:MAG: hypothetical protein LV471_11100 [Nitrosomonas sp.]|nr:hypothetical protein [Nitrosomonas sp.]